MQMLFKHYAKALQTLCKQSFRKLQKPKFWLKADKDGDKEKLNPKKRESKLYRA